jgi:hypothetical protein
LNTFYRSGARKAQDSILLFSITCRTAPKIACTSGIRENYLLRLAETDVEAILVLDTAETDDHLGLSYLGFQGKSRTGKLFIDSSFLEPA